MQNTKSNAEIPREPYDLDLQKLGNLIQQANQKASRISLKGLLKGLKRLHANEPQGQ
jgi:hypothetical protein